MVSSSTSTEPETPATVTDEKVDVYEVSLEPEDDPKNVSTARKWLAVAIISLGSLCVTCASSMAAFGEDQIAKEFNTPTEVNILGISLYVFALGNGTLLVSPSCTIACSFDLIPKQIGPLSEIYGRLFSSLILKLFSPIFIQDDAFCTRAPSCYFGYSHGQ